MPVVSLEDGISIRTFCPPSGFDPLSASAAELGEYGFPARPENPRHLALYRRVFGRLKGRLKYVEPTFRINPRKTNDPRNRNYSGGPFTGNNWSGGVVQPPHGESFRQVLGEWVVPNASPPTPGGSFSVCYWVGLDGFFTGPGAFELLQAGVKCELSGSPSTTVFYLWHQWYPSSQVEITNPTINAGDLVMILLSATPGVAPTTAMVYFTNISSGAATSYAITAPTAVQLAGTSAEWIVEAPDADQLPDYGLVFFHSCMACSASSTVNGGSGEMLNIVQGGIVQGGNIISQATAVTPAVVECRYVT
jgi:hypothetical protein